MAFWKAVFATPLASGHPVAGVVFPMPRGDWRTPLASDADSSGSDEALSDQVLGEEFPTPLTSDGRHGENCRVDQPRNGLAAAVRRRFPTPKARDYKSGNADRTRRIGHGNADLPDVVALDNGFGLTDDGQGTLFDVPHEEPESFPTPMASDSDRGSDGGTRQGGPSLTDMVKKAVKRGDVQIEWPTPRGSEGGVGLVGGQGAFNKMARIQQDGGITDEERRQMSSGNGGQLNPDWVELLMGWPRGWTMIDEQAATWLNARCLEKGLKPKFKGLASSAEVLAGRSNVQFLDPWAAGWEDGVPRTASDVPNRVERLKVCGNGVVPQQATWAWLVLLWVIGIEPDWGDA